MNVDLSIPFKHLLTFLNDERITVWHIATMVGILQLASGDIINPIFISRRKVMRLSRINSIATYHKCIKELQRFGYLEYYPSYHPGIRTKIIIKTDVFCR